MQSFFSWEQFHTSRLRSSSKILTATLVTGMVLYAIQPQANADVKATGDVTPQHSFDSIIGDEPVTYWDPFIPSTGGRLTEEVDDGMGGTTEENADLIVGGTGVFSGTIITGPPEIKIGTTIGVVTIGVPASTLPLIAENIIIGHESYGNGRITISDLGSKLIADFILTVGDEGRGELRIINGSQVHAGIYNETDFRYEDGEMIVGSQASTTGSTQFVSEGFVVVDGFGSLLESEKFTVADEGLGTVEISGKATLVTLESIIGESAGSLGRVSVSGLGSRWNNLEFISGGGVDAGKITIGDLGAGIVDINDQAIVSADVVEINSQSFVNLGGGTLLTNNEVDNSGVIRGYGRIQSDLDINGSGELRNKADVGGIEYLIVTGDVLNNGTIESLGGEMEFESLVTNNLEIIARDAVLRFTAGLTNNGTLSVGGETTIHGDITGAGSIHVMSDSATTIVGDLTFSASSILSLTVGDSPGTLDILGTADMTGALIDLNYSAGIMSQPGDSYQIFQASGGIIGFVPTVAVADGRIWDITQSGDILMAEATGAAAAPVGADFNGDGIVDGIDLNIWEMNIGATGSPPLPGDADGDGDVDGADFIKIQLDLGGPPTPAFFAASSAIVPEPSSALLLVLGSLLIGTGSLGRKRN